MYISMCVYVCINVSMCAYVCVCMYVCMYVHMYEYMNVCTHDVSVCVYKHACTSLATCQCRFRMTLLCHITTENGQEFRYKIR